MANKGSFDTTAYGGRHLTFSWSIKSQDPKTNKTVIDWSLKGAGDESGYYKAGGFKVVINGATVYSKTTDYRIELYSGTKVASGTATITHDTDGTKTFSASAEAGIYYYAVNCKGEGKWDLTPIERYATASQSLNDKTETSIKMNWESDSTVDYIEYSKDDGSNWTGVNVTDGKSGTYTISGLTANTTYKIKTRVRRKDNQLKTASTALSVTTYDYPHCIEAPAFVIGESVSLGFYNPLGRTFTFNIIANAVQLTHTWSVSGTSYNSSSDETIYSLEAEIAQTELYNSIPDKLKASYYVRVTYGDSVRNYAVLDGYRVDPVKCVPTFTDFNYYDAGYSFLTGDDKIFIKGHSHLAVNISSVNKMVAVNGASPVNYIVTVDTLSKPANYNANGQIIDVGSINSAGVKRLNVRAYDSRGLHTLVSKDITVIDYTEPVVNVDIKRLNNFESQTTLKISGKYSRLTINGADKNSIALVKYHYREINGDWLDEVELIPTETAGDDATIDFVCDDVVLSLDNSKTFEFEVSVADNVGYKTLNAVVDVGQAIFFISTNKKKCYINNVEIPTFDTAYPVSSVFCNSTNTNPSEIYGGTWELIDKGFKYGSTTISQPSTDYLSKFDVMSVRSGNTIRLRFSLTTAQEITDATTRRLGSVDLASHGLVQDPFLGYFTAIVYSGITISDGANAVILVYFRGNGVLEIAECFQSNGTHTLPSGTSFYYDVVLPLSPDQMANEFCDKFYWRRVE
jgi:hypothetical protein